MAFVIRDRVIGLKCHDHCQSGANHTAGLLGPTQRRKTALIRTVTYDCAQGWGSSVDWMAMKGGAVDRRDYVFYSNK